MSEMVLGYFTIERSIINLSLREIEVALGFPPGYLGDECRILQLLREPRLNEFIQQGSTLYPGGDGLSTEELARTNFIPGAWLGQRLIKVAPRVRNEGVFPKSPRAVEQWKLLVAVPAEEIRRLGPKQRYF